jgi:hypothetical protein
MQNDLTVVDIVIGYGVYPTPISDQGLAMVDTRDITEVAVVELLRPEQAPGSLPLSWVVWSTRLH